MATQDPENTWALSQLITAAEKFTFADGKADINETRALIGLVHPFAEVERGLADFEKLLVDIAEDGVVTPEESVALAAAIANLRTKFQTADGVYDARTLGLPKMGVLGVQHMFAMFGATILVPILTGLSPSATLLWAGATSRLRASRARLGTRTARRPSCSSTPASASPRRRSCTSSWPGS